MTRITSMIPASGHWAVYYDHLQDSVVADAVIAWALINGDVTAMVLEREAGKLVPAQEYANYLGVASNGDLKSASDKLLARGRAMRKWLVEEEE